MQRRARRQQPALAPNHATTPPPSPPSPCPRPHTHNTTQHSTRKLEFTGRTQRCLNLGSYNYLGFAAADEYCTPRVLDTMADWGISACSSRADGGTAPLHAELEQLVADFLGVEDAITYGMGFATNSASIPALCGPGTLVLSDALNHTSIVAGVKASGAAVKVFRHNDAAHLERQLRFHIAEGQPRTHRPWRKVVIIVEGIYSMEGEATPLAEIVALKKRYGAYLYLDEAHSIGAMGATGRGLCEHAGVDPRDVDVLMGTFTKSFGSAGGYVAGSRKLIAYLRRHSPAHLYAASVAPGAAQQIISALKLIRGDDGSGRGAAKVRQLHDNANYFRRRLIDMGLHVLGDWDSPVMPVMVYHIGLLAALSRLLYARHIAMVVVGFPATALLLCRCRVCISAAHTREDLDYALDCLKELATAAGLDFDARGGRGLLGGAWRRLRALLPFGGGAGGSSSTGSGSGSGSGGARIAIAEGSPRSRRTSSCGGSSCDGAGAPSSSTDCSSCTTSEPGSRPASAASSWPLGGEERPLVKA